MSSPIIFFEDRRVTMDFIFKSSFTRSGLVQYGLMAAFYGIGAAISPMIFDAIRAGTTPGWFDQALFVLATALTFSALRLDDTPLRKRIVIWLIRLFAIEAVFALGFTPLSIAFAVVSFAYGSIEWPHATEQEVAAA